MVHETDVLITAEEFARLPDDGTCRELVRGEVIEMTPGSFEAGRISLRIGARIENFLEQHDAGAGCTADAGFLLMEDPDVVRCPDIAFVVRERVDALGAPTGFFRGAPDLAVEVVSPTDRATDLQSKVSQYLDAGTALVWVVYPETRQVIVHRPEGEVAVIGDNGVLTGDPVLPGLSIPVKDVFAK